MKKTLLFAAALVCSGAVAQEKEIWACQAILGGTAGFKWENGKWVNAPFNEINMLVTIDGSNSVIKEDGFDYPFACRATSSIVGALVSCSSKNSFFVLNSESGQAGFSNLFGAADPDREQRDTVTTALFECTKF